MVRGARAACCMKQRPIGVVVRGMARTGRDERISGLAAHDLVDAENMLDR